jgi:hypothetical protein
MKAIYGLAREEIVGGLTEMHNRELLFVLSNTYYQAYQTKKNEWSCECCMLQRDVNFI